MSTFFGQAIEENQELKVNFNNFQQKQQQWHLLLTHVALDVNSDVSHLYLKIQQKEILLLSINRNNPPLFSSINIRIDSIDSPYLVAKSGKIHVSGYFFQQKLYKEQKQDIKQKSSDFSVRKIQARQQQPKVKRSSRLSHTSKILEASPNEKKTKQKKSYDQQDQFFVSKTVASRQKQGEKSQKEKRNKDKKQILDEKKQGKRSSFSMLIRQAEKQDSDQEESDEDFDQSQQSDSDDDEFSEDQDDQDDTPPARQLKNKTDRIIKRDSKQQDKSKGKTTIEIGQQAQQAEGQSDKSLSQNKILKVWPGMGTIRVSKQQLNQVDFSQWTDPIKAPTKKPSFL